MDRAILQLEDILNNAELPPYFSAKINFVISEISQLQAENERLKDGFKKILSADSLNRTERMFLDDPLPYIYKVAEQALEEKP